VAVQVCHTLQVDEKSLYLTFFLVVDKIIIDQTSLSTFINTVHPGAYQSMTKVDFRVLDNHGIKPVGIYGSKKEIMAFLVSIQVINADK
jgi:hypothetical protein